MLDVHRRVMRYTLVRAVWIVVLLLGPPVGAKDQLTGAFPQKFLSAEATQLFTQNFQLFGDYITQQTGIGIKILALEDAAAIRRDLLSGKIDFFFGLADLEALQFQEAGVGQPFLTVSPFRDLPNTRFQHLLIVKKPAPSSLKGWTLRPVEDYGETYKGVPSLLAEILIREGLPMRLHTPEAEPPSKIQVVEYGQSRDLILQVITRERVGAVIDEEAYLMMKRRNPKIEEALQVIASLSPVPVTPLFIRKDLDPGQRGRIRSCLLAMHRDARGDEILRSLRLGKWVEVGPKDYDDLRSLVERARKLGIPLTRERYAAGH